MFAKAVKWSAIAALIGVAFSRSLPGVEHGIPVRSSSGSRRRPRPGRESGPVPDLVSHRCLPVQS